MEGLFMSNLEVLEKLVAGTSAAKEVIVNFEDNDYPFKLRPLTDGELTKLKKIENGSLTFKVKIDDNGKRKGKPETENQADINTGEYQEGQVRAKYTAIAYSLSVDGETFPVEKVEDFPKGLPDIVFKEVIKISGLEAGDLAVLKNFL